MTIDTLEFFDPEDDPLIQAYHEQSPAQQWLLKVIAVVCKGLNQSELNSVMSNLRSRFYTKLTKQHQMSKANRESLVEAGLLRPYNNVLQCGSARLRYYLIRLALADDSYQAIWAAGPRLYPSGRRISPLSPYSLGEQCNLEEAFFHGDTLRVLKAFEPKLTAVHHRPLAYEVAEPLLELFVQMAEPGFLEQLPLDLRFHCLAPLLEESACRLQPQFDAFDCAWKWFTAWPNRPAEVTRFLARQCLWRGETASALELLGNDDTAQAAALRGWAACQQGDFPAAREHYAPLIANQRAISRNKSHLYELPGVLLSTVLLNQGHQQDIEQAAELAEFGLYGEARLWSAIFVNLLTTIKTIHKGGEATEVSFSERGTVHFPYALLFYNLELYWLNQTPPKPKREQLARFARQALESEWYWFAVEAAQLLRACGHPLDDALTALLDTPAEAAGGGHLVHAVRVRARWERVLDALQQVGRADSTAETPAERRLIWQLNMHNGYPLLEPREQKRNKRGGWTKGRAVALRHFAEKPDQLDYLMPEDQRIIRHIQREPDFYRFGSWHFELNQQAAIVAAVGHPRIFYPQDLNTPLELVQDKPILEVRKTKQGYRFHLIPFPAEGSFVYVQPEGEHRVRVIEFDSAHLQIADWLGKKGLQVPASAKSRILESLSAVAPVLTVHADIEGAEAFGVADVEADTRVSIQIVPEGQGLHFDLYMRPLGESGPWLRPGEGLTQVLAEIDGQRVRTQRDFEAENASVQQVLDACPALVAMLEHWQAAIAEPEQALAALQQLQALGDEVSLNWPRGQRLRVSPDLTAQQMQIQVKKQRDWFGLEGQLALDDEQVVDMQHLLELLQQTPGRFVRLGEEQILALSDELRRRLESLRAVSESGRVHPAAAATLAEATETMDVKASKPWREQLQRLKAARDLEPAIPSTLQAELRDYQVSGFQWLARLAHWGGGACLADDMGLGKTVQILALILTRAADGPTLVLAPTSVCDNWLTEADRFAPTLNAKRFGPGDRQQMLTTAGPFDMLVCSYGLLQTEAEALAQVHWQTLVADEAQALKNPDTKRAQAAFGLTGAFKTVATGTPIENRLSELWSLFQFINPGLLGSRKRFEQRYANPIEQQRDSGARQRLKQLLKPFILRRLKSEVLSELPERTETTIHVEPSADEAALYEALRRQAIDRVAAEQGHTGQQRLRVLAEITRLRRACCNPSLVAPAAGVASSKLQAFAELVEELLANRHKALVFSQFVDHLQLVRDHLDGQGIHYQYLDGSTPINQRKQAVEAFQRGEGDLFLISLKAGGSGLNLTAADYVIHMDPWWNPAVEDQAADRTHRIGQQRPVTIYRLVLKDTIEDKIVELHRDKRDLATSLLAGTDVETSVSVDEMMELLAAQANSN